ncbi:GatB/YqeY domain-containing protein [Brevibacillus sp. NPDC058079]|uniref:GatB/YqeY domain-containing protein n=1 Tax=Brevibacillus sp. NPDC058079 TaxID=3346330 RepID=UPI0036E2CE8E
MTQVEKSKTQIQLEADMKEAMKAKAKESLATIRLILDRLQKKAKEKLVDFVSDEEAVSVIQTVKKQVQEEIEGFQKAGKIEKVVELQASLELIAKYLPAQMSKEEIQEIVRGIVEKLGVNANMGTVMKEIMPMVKGKADNKLVNVVVTEALK